MANDLTTALRTLNEAAYAAEKAARQADDPRLFSLTQLAWVTDALIDEPAPARRALPNEADA